MGDATVNTRWKHLDTDDDNDNYIGVLGNGGPKEVSREIKATALTADCTEKEITNILFGNREEMKKYEEILDDFWFTAAQEPMNPEEGGKEG